MKNLGKTVLFLLLLTTTSFAKIVANVNPSVVYEGENATYTLNISGSSFHKPNLTDICGNEIISTGSQTSTQLINGHYSKDYILMYEFTPTKSCVIPSVEVEVDGKLEKSNSINLRVKKMERDPNADFFQKPLNSGAINLLASASAPFFSLTRSATVKGSPT